MGSEMCIRDRYYAMLNVANEWCNDGRGSAMSNEECHSRLVSYGSAPTPKRSGVHTHQFSGQTMSWWDFTMYELSEDEDASYAFSYFRSFYDPSTDTTTVWYAYASPVNR